MSVLITGGTGYLGSYVTQHLLRTTQARLSLLVRAKDREEARAKLWRSLQLHMDQEELDDLLPRVDFVFGNLEAPSLGLEPTRYEQLAGSIESILHIAASLNRKSEKACLNTNLRGTLSMIKLARAAADRSGLRRFSHVSTVAVAGQRDHEVVREDEAIDWNRSDYDPYGRTKKFCEHMARELLPDVALTFFRPAIVMGDSRFPQTTQFDMVRAFCWFADLPVLPFKESVRLDIVNADFVGPAIAALHMKDQPKHDTYHLSAGTSSRTTGEIVRALVSTTGKRAPRFVPELEHSFSAAVNATSAVRWRNPLSHVATLLRVFLPYITYDTVFDNRRVTEELGIEPVPFTEYCAELYKYSKHVRFEYPYVPLARPKGEPHGRGQLAYA